jgi:hemoglobin
MQKDISAKEDIILLVNRFYEKVQEDAELGRIFNEVAQLNWEKHLPLMYEFWETVLMGKGNYKGNPVASHVKIHKLGNLTAEHFDRWLDLFRQTVNENFSGLVADQAIIKAMSISAVLQAKLFSGEA